MGILNKEMFRSLAGSLTCASLKSMEIKKPEQVGHL